MRLLLLPFRMLFDVCALVFWSGVQILGFAPLLLCVWAYVGFSALLTDALSVDQGFVMFFVSGVLFSAAQMLLRQKRLGRIRPPKSRSLMALRSDTIRKARAAKTPLAKIGKVGRSSPKSLRAMQARLPGHLRELMR